MEKKKTLLEKYGLPINHLDFAYVGTCSDAREMEKIVHILRSGEEGFFPDLTRCAEEKLRELKPDSRLFRLEEPIRDRHSLPADEWKPIYDWTNEIKKKDNKLALVKEQEAQQKSGDLNLDLPPIRKTAKISEHKTEATPVAKSGVSEAKSTERICSTDYSKWDKYDPDVELLKMDLAEERVKEEVERKNLLNLQKSTTTPKIVELDDNKKKEVLKKWSDIEREKLAEEYRLRGNEYFKVKEYEHAIDEYSKSINMDAATAAPAYNNRAIANIKQQKYLEAIDDCEQCLKLEPRNIKALLRKAEASYGYGRRREAYNIYLKVLELDAGNAIALKATAELRVQLGDLPPPSATRIQIAEDAISPTTAKRVTAKKSTQPGDTAKTAKSTAKPTCKPKDYDLADLIVPNRVVQNKLTTAAAALGQSMQQTKQRDSSASKMPNINNDRPELRLPTSIPSNLNNGKLLIEEI